MSGHGLTLLMVCSALLFVALMVILATQQSVPQKTQDQANQRIPIPESTISKEEKGNVMLRNESEPQLPSAFSTAAEPQPAPAFLKAGLQLSHIHLTIMDSNLTLKDDLPPRVSSISRSLVLRNNSVLVNSRGFYYFYAHVTFSKMTKPAKRMVTLIRNAIPGQLVELSLSEAMGVGEQEGSISFSQIIRCQRGQTLRLEISPRKFRRNPQHTYWGLFLLTPY